MSFPQPLDNSRRFNPPPNWPAPPPGWTPPPGWVPDPSWPPPPQGWQLWIEDSGPVSTVPGESLGASGRKSGGAPRWLIIAGAVVIGVIIAAVTPGVLGHVFALIVWGFAAWICLRPARSKVKSAVRTWARIGVVAFAVFTLYAGSLAIVGAVGHSGSAGGGGGTAARHCYYQVQDTLGGNKFTVAILGVSDCTNYAVGNSEFAVTGINTAKGSGSAICMGTDGGQPGTVITTQDNYGAGEAYCESAGWTDVPQG